MLPGPYERWFTEVCGRPSPVESRSTCDSCAMLPGAADLPPEGPFDPAVRCCTYHPHLAPHFVGGILRDGTDAGRAVVRARIAAREGVTPLGLGPPAGWDRLAHKPGSFGHSHDLLCPFYDSGRCTIWQHRGAACAAFHCKFDRGALGFGLWNLITLAFNAVERGLAGWLLRRQGLDAEACDALLHASTDAALDTAAWGKWRGREEQYFLEAAALIEPLSWTEVAAISHLAPLADALRGAVERLDSLQPPRRVRRGGEILHHLGRPGTTRLQNRSIPFDPLEVPSAVAERVARLEEAPLHELGLDDQLVRRLIDWQALVPAAV
jgi:Fe-S-cluster containining protein